LSAAPSSSDTAQCTQVVTVRPGTSYTLTGWVNGSNTYLGVTGTGGTDPSTWATTSGSWQKLTVPFTTGASTTSITVFTHGWYGTGTYYADDIGLA
jgi:hypothetical protein